MDRSSLSLSESSSRRLCNSSSCLRAFSSLFLASCRAVSASRNNVTTCTDQCDEEDDDDAEAGKGGEEGGPAGDADAMMKTMVVGRSNDGEDKHASRRHFQPARHNGHFYTDGAAGSGDGATDSNSWTTLACMCCAANSGGALLTFSKSMRIGRRDTTSPVSLSNIGSKPTWRHDE